MTCACMLRSCCVTRYLRRSAEADLFGERPSLCAVRNQGKSRFGHHSRVSSRDLRPSCSGFDVGFIFPVLLPRPQTVPLRGSHRPKIFGLERRIRPQLFQSKWIGFAAPLAPGRIFTGGSWLKWREVPESSVLLTPPYVQSVRGSARAQTTEIAKFGYFSSTSLESSAAARFDL